MKIIHNVQICIGCGLCASICPDFWEINSEDNKAHLKGQRLEAEEKQDITVEGCAGEAAESCPVQAIKIEKE